MTVEADPSHRSAPQETSAEPPSRRILRSMARGASFRCPACGTGALYRAYLKVSDHCPSCGEALHHQRADDAPPYLTIFAVGHIMIPLVLAVDAIDEWPMWIEAAVWLPLVAGLALILLPVMKGALVGLQWALRMHGFGEDSTEALRLAAYGSPRE